LLLLPLPLLRDAELPVDPVEPEELPLVEPPLEAVDPVEEPPELPDAVPPTDDPDDVPPVDPDVDPVALPEPEAPLPLLIDAMALRRMNCPPLLPLVPVVPLPLLALALDDEPPSRHPV